MSDGTYNRPQRLLEPRGQDQRGQDQRGQGSRGFDPPERRSPASDPLLELARLIGQSDPFAPVKGRAGDPPRGTGETAERASQDRVPQERAPFIRPPSRDDGANQERGPLDRIFPNRPVQDRASQDRAFQDRQAQDRPFEDPAPLDRPEPDFG